MSLQRRLLWILGLSFSLLWLLAAFWLQRDLEQRLQDTLDQRLAASARMVGGLVMQLPEDAWQVPGGATLSVPADISVACQVRDGSGGIFLQTHSALPDLLAGGGVGFHDRDIGGEPWRVYTREFNGLFISTADRLTERHALQREILFAAALPFVIALLGSLLALWLGIRRGLRPLARLRDALSQRDPASPEAVDIGPVPDELAPVLTTLDRLLRDTGDLLHREQRFTSDAAHELRTPLTAIKTHLQVARRTDPARADASLAQAEAAVARLQRTLEHLLMLARLDSHEDWPTGTRIGLDVLLQQIRDALPPTERLHLPRTLPARAPHLPSELAAVALRNLLDNALRHTRGAVTVQVTETQDDELLIEVCDEGERLSDTDISQLTRRFWRHPSSDGSGLGLAITEAIARRAGGRLELAPGQAGGLRATLCLPAYPARAGRNDRST
ncbi:two-component sensor [Isoalcanivorax pacificus W11-5]|uniref:histidine kinase n=1 Tax=Isoalcanivorax pacificus W11-5 TaxID=391936 RepID=A0A0B4XLF4_9GAMM|nr:ATP-binding protein [Isoalcanivorax pacificus]AJD47505.1 two-component sensor [Isoalcanivorax pacificus W11-5]